jgi:hypothetical protein
MPVAGPVGGPRNLSHKRNFLFLLIVSGHPSTQVKCLKFIRGGFLILLGYGTYSKKNILEMRLL